MFWFYVLWLWYWNLHLYFDLDNLEKCSPISKVWRSQDGASKGGCGPIWRLSDSDSKSGDYNCIKLSRFRFNWLAKVKGSVSMLTDISYLLDAIVLVQGYNWTAIMLSRVENYLGNGASNLFHVLSNTEVSFSKSHLKWKAPDIKRSNTFLTSSSSSDRSSLRYQVKL